MTARIQITLRAVAVHVTGCCSIKVKEMWVRIYSKNIRVMRCGKCDFVVFVLLTKSYEYRMRGGCHGETE